MKDGVPSSSLRDPINIPDENSRRIRFITHYLMLQNRFRWQRESPVDQDCPWTFSFLAGIRPHGFFGIYSDGSANRSSKLCQELHGDFCIWMAPAGLPRPKQSRLELDDIDEYHHFYTIQATHCSPEKPLLMSYSPGSNARSSKKEHFWIHAFTCDLDNTHWCTFNWNDLTSQQPLTSRHDGKQENVSGNVEEDHTATPCLHWFCHSSSSLPLFVIALV